MKHICEICNKQYDTVAGAEQCELAHKKEAAEKLAKTATEAKINDALNAYIARYKELPAIELSTENQRLLFGDIVDKLENTLDTLVNVLFGCDDEDADGCICKKCTNQCGDTNAE